MGDKVPTDGRGGGEWGEMHVGDAAIVALARRQHGIVTVAQLLEAGFSRSAVSHRVRRGWLVAVFRGVYQVGPVRAPRGLEMAAVLATGGVLSHHSAASLWGIRAHDGDVHVSVSGRDQRPRPGLRIHRSHSLNAAVQDGLPLTTPTRTIHDLATCLPQPELDRAVEQAQILHLATRDQIAADMPRRGRAASEVDLFWPDQRLVVEIDGYRVVRFTWRPTVHDSHALVAQLSALLSAPVA
jgi:predicted transcriptional regulator of viral defense system